MQSPNDLILYPSALSLTWELRHVDVYVGSYRVLGATYISTPCSSRTSILIYDVRITSMNGFVHNDSNSYFRFDYEHQKVYTIKIRATDESGLNALRIRVKLLMKTSVLISRVRNDLLW